LNKIDHIYEKEITEIMIFWSHFYELSIKEIWKTQFICISEKLRKYTFWCS